MTVAPQRPRALAVWATSLIVLALAALRLAHLGADTPASISDWGALVDEGYKTWSPRNLVLFGDSQLHPDDPYKGWMRASPLTQWAYYGAFRILGTRIESARAVTIVFFGLFLAAYGWAMRPRYPPGIFLAGLLALGLEGTTFFFSRIAIFEIPICFFVYGLLFALVRLGWSSPLRTVGLLLIVGAFVSLTVKLTAAIYVLLIAAAALCYWADKERGRQKSVRIAALIAAAALALFVGLYFDTLQAKLGLSARNFLGRILDNPAVEAAPALSAFTAFCAAHGMLAASDRFRRDPYRLSLISLVLLGPILLALFSIHPLRYYVPLLPAQILLGLEWAAERMWREPIRLLPHPAAVLGWPALWLAVYQTVDGLLLAPMAERFPQLGKASVCAVVTVALVLLRWRWRHRLLAASSLRAGAAALALLTCVRAVSSVGAFLIDPSYRREEIRQALSRSIESGTLIAGDWAPLFALGTDLPAHYTRYNFVEDDRYFDKLRPSYYVYSESGWWTSQPILQTFERQQGVSLGQPVFEGSYAGRTVIVYRLLYDRESDHKSKSPKLSQRNLPE